jgi:hypothetical protein
MQWALFEIYRDVFGKGVLQSAFFSLCYFLGSAYKKLMIGGVGAASGSEQLRSMQRRERNASYATPPEGNRRAPRLPGTSLTVLSGG